jgi:hypothetical protein
LPTILLSQFLALQGKQVDDFKHIIDKAEGNWGVEPVEILLDTLVVYGLCNYNPFALQTRFISSLHFYQLYIHISKVFHR